jgi:hypothetical protein
MEPVDKLDSAAIGGVGLLLLLLFSIRPADALTGAKHKVDRGHVANPAFAGFCMTSPPRWRRPPFTRLSPSRPSAELSVAAGLILKDFLSSDDHVR